VTPTDWTAILGSLVTLVTALVWPSILARRRARITDQQNSNDTWQGMFDRQGADKDKLQKRYDERDAYYSAQLSLVEARFKNEIDDLQGVVKQQQEQLDSQGITIRAQDRKIGELLVEISRLNRRDQ